MMILILSLFFMVRSDCACVWKKDVSVIGGGRTHLNET